MFKPTKSKAAPGEGRREQDFDRAGSGSLHPHYTRFVARLQYLLGRLTMRFALLLVDAGDTLAGIALRWECGL